MEVVPPVLAVSEDPLPVTASSPVVVATAAVVPAAHAILPCDAAYTYTRRLGGQPLSRWSLFQKLSLQPIACVADLSDFLRALHPETLSRASFPALEFYCNNLSDVHRDELFRVTLPAMVQWALRLPTLVSAPLPLLVPGVNQVLRLPRSVVLSLLCCAFFGLAPRQGPPMPAATYIPPSVVIHDFLPAESAMEVDDIDGIHVARSGVYPFCSFVKLFQGSSRRT